MAVHEGFSCPAQQHEGWCNRDDCVGAVCAALRDPQTELQSNVGALAIAARIRARIVAALTAETGDAATAERLAGVVVQALA